MGIAASCRLPLQWCTARTSGHLVIILLCQSAIKQHSKQAGVGALQGSNQYLGRSGKAQWICCCLILIERRSNCIQSSVIGSITCTPAMQESAIDCNRTAICEKGFSVMAHVLSGQSHGFCKVRQVYTGCVLTNCKLARCICPWHSILGEHDVETLKSLQTVTPCRNCIKFSFHICVRCAV